MAINETLRKIYGDNVTLVTPSVDELLGKYEKSDKLFKRIERGGRIIYRHQRMIDDAIVEFDRTVYLFNRTTKELIEKIIHWRDDLPEHLPTVIPKKQAESIAGGGSATLYFIDPESNVFPIKPAPKNPCWVVWNTDNITIIDAVEGSILGYGIPPPSAGLSFSGPKNRTTCTGVWTDWYENAELMFESMGYFPTHARIYPNEETVRSHIQSYETAMFYEVAHGGSGYFENNCTDTITANEIHNWIVSYPKMPFTFLASCDGMCDTGAGTLSYEFRKGSTDDTTTVGYCGMGGAPCNQTCWGVAVKWQDTLFNKMNQGWTVKEAFDWACDVYEECYIESTGTRCVRFAGDTNFKVVPVVGRGPVAIAKSDFRINNIASKGISKAYFNGTDSYDLGGTITEWRWWVDDGSSLVGEIVEHLFKVPMYWQGGSGGHYVPANITLTVTDDGMPLMDNSTTMDVTVWIAGDATGDGRVNIADAVTFGMQFGAACSIDANGLRWWDNKYGDKADLNNDARVNIGDAMLLGTCWGHTAW